MAKANDLADGIRNAARQFKHFQDVADMLDKYGSFENAVKEQELALKKVQDERAVGILALAEQAQKVEAAQKRHTDLIADANTQAAAIVEAANTAAFDTNVAAKAEAAQVLEAAKTAALSKKNSLSDDILALTEAKVRISDDIAAMQASVDSINAQAKAAEERLAKVNAAIAKFATV